MKDKASRQQVLARSPSDNDAPLFLALQNLISVFDYDQCKVDNPKRWELLESIDFRDRQQVEKVVREILEESLPDVMERSSGNSSFMRNLLRDFNVFIGSPDISIWDSSLAGHLTLSFARGTRRGNSETARLGREFINSLYRVIFGDLS